MAVELVAVRARDTLEAALEGGVVERLDPPAGVADEMVVVLSARERRLEPGGAVAEIDPVNEPGLSELLERAVDARDADPLPFSAEGVEELLRREAAVLPRKAGDDLVAGSAPAGASAAQLLANVMRPCLVHRPRG